LLLSVPCVAAFLIVPELIMRALFMRGAFSAGDAKAAAMTLAAYAAGLFPFVLIRSVTATFYARGDTATPVKASLAAVAVNIVFKVLLMGPLAQVGLAIATSIGAWINLLLVFVFAARAGLITLDERLRFSLVRLSIAAIGLAAFIFAGHTLIAAYGLRDELALAVLVLGSAMIYGGAILLLLGPSWLRGFMARGTSVAIPPQKPS
jgi:putative peptidoglycan lipid II flippase